MSNNDATIRLAEAEMLRAMIDNIICRSLQRNRSESEKKWMMYLNDLRSEVLVRQDGFYKETQAG
jgi:hypothetical protein